MTQHPLPPRSGVTLLIAASNASETTIDRADFVCAGQNDHVTIATAIGSLPLDGEDRQGTIQLSEGTFSVGATILVSGHIQILGSGWGTKLVAVPAMNAYIFTLLPHTLPATITQGAEGIRLANLFLDHNAPAQTGGGCIDGFGARLCVFDHLHLSRPYEAGIKLRGLDAGSLAGGNTIISCTFDGGNTSNGNGCGLLLQKSTENRVTCCTFVGAAGTGNVSQPDPCAIADQTGGNCYTSNVLRGCSIGLHATGSVGSLITGNLFEQTTTSAIMLNTSSNSGALLSQNTFTTNAGTVISCTSATGIVLSQNTFIGSTGTVISCDSTTVGIVISQNTFTGSTGTVVSIDGTQQTITANIVNGIGSAGYGIISPTSLTQSVITSNVFTTSANTATAYIALTSSSRDILEQNVFDPAGPAPTVLLSNDTTSLLRHNSGFVTESSGAASIATGISSITVSHGIDPSLAVKAQHITITPTFMGYNTIWILSAVNNTSFTLSLIGTTAGQSNGGFNFGWHVQVF